MYSDTNPLPAVVALDEAPNQIDQPPVEVNAAAPTRSRRRRLGDKVLVRTTTQLLPLVKLLDAIQPQLANESVFRTRRKKLKAHWLVAYRELKAERPKHQVLTHAFHTLAELVREESRDISPDELKQAAREVVLATLRHAPALINAAHQARLLS